MTDSDAGSRPDTTTSSTETPAGPVDSASSGAHSEERLGGSRAGRLRVALIASAVVLALLLVFVLQNGQRVKVSFLGLSGHLPLAVAILFAAVGGALLLAIPGTVRIMQLRRAATNRQHPDGQSHPPKRHHYRA
jgi:lipopolysaccharide assembly protein A